MHLPGQSILLHLLGWELFNSLWQMAALWLIFQAITLGGKKFSPGARYFIALILLAAGSLWFILSLLTGLFMDNPTEQYFAAFGIIANKKFAFIISCRYWFNLILPYCSLLYMAILFGLAARYTRQYIFSQQLKHCSLDKAPEGLRVFMEDIAASIGIHKTVKLWFSSAARSPMTIGFMKPVILIPMAAVNHLSTSQMEAVLLHELAHIKRNDYLVNLLIAVTEIIFFFNPFAICLTSTIKRERENSCDDLVLQFKYDPCGYASALLSLEVGRNNYPSLVMAAIGKNKMMLLHRVMRITGHKKTKFENKLQVVLFMLMGLAIAFIALARPKQIVAPIMSAGQGISFAEPLFLSYMNKAPVVIKKQSRAAKLSSKTLRRDIAAGKNKVDLAPVNFVNNNNDIQSSEDNSGTIAVDFPTIASTYSFLSGDRARLPDAEASSPNAPYIPSASFLYNDVEDANIPKPGLDQIQKETADANLAMENASQALKLIGLRNLARATFVDRQNIRDNIEKLEDELQRSIEQLDSNQLPDVDFVIQLNNAGEARLKKDLEVQLLALGALKNASSPKAKQLSGQIIRQQFKIQQADLQKQQELIKKLHELNKKLKIVYI
ncbi:MAG: M56 family metallopeptidase [Bacteroidetes bacterium]|nr:M56 family metallopeptidase [Bacteroidota bacterium]MBS1974188.1 M56 family metallopeptidase [Bacteroidota bacterium]